MPIKIAPEYEKIWDYLVKRKTPVTIKQTIKVLRISDTHAKRALEHFVFCKIAERHEVGRVMTYKVKE